MIGISTLIEWWAKNHPEESVMPVKCEYLRLQDDLHYSKLYRSIVVKHNRELLEQAKDEWLTADELYQKKVKDASMWQPSLKTKVVKDITYVTFGDVTFGLTYASRVELWRSGDAPELVWYGYCGDGEEYGCKPKLFKPAVLAKIRVTMCGDVSIYIECGTYHVNALVYALSKLIHVIEDE